MEDRQKLFYEFMQNCVEFGKTQEKLGRAHEKVAELEKYTDAGSLSLWHIYQQQVYELTIKLDELDIKITQFMLDELNSD